MRTRAFDAKLHADQESALGEVLAQLDAEDEASEPPGSDSDYEDDGAGAASTRQVAGGSVGEAGRNGSAAASDDDDGGAGSDAEVADDDSVSKGNNADTADEVESESSRSRSDESEPSGLPQKRHRKGNRKAPRKSARKETTSSPGIQDPDEHGAFLEGFSCRWDSWEDFHRAFEEFQAATFQNFSSRTSTSVASRNNQMRNAIMGEAKTSRDTVQIVEKRKGTRFIPDEWQKYCKTLRCTHGRTQKPRGTGKRKHLKTRSTKCSAKINARVVSGYSGWYIALKASGRHNHPVTKHQWFNYAENRTITDEGLTADVAKMHKAGAHAKGILAYLREKSGKLVALRDVHNMIQRFKIEQKAGLTDAERALAILDEFCTESDGNVAEMMVDADSNVARVIAFQSARMKRLFRAFPEVVLVDATHDTNANRYKLFSFAVHDVFGKSEEKDNLRLAVKCFQKHNPAWANVRVIVTDKAMHEKAVLREYFPAAHQLLCQWHVITWLKKQATRLAPAYKKQVKGVVKSLVYAISSQEYQDAKNALLETLGQDDEDPMYQFFLKNWDKNQDEWVSYKRGNIAHLGNNTNNRLECKWGKIKQVVEAHFTLDETITALITLQRIAEDEYVAQYHEVGSRPDLGEDPELAALGMQISEFAFKMVAEQHAFAVNTRADDEVDLSVPGKATLTRPGTGSTHVVDTSTCACDCIFMKTCLLPCRNVIHVRFMCNYETVVPPLRTFSTRWIVHAPQNNIDEGDVGAGGLFTSSCAAMREEPAVTSTDKYIQTKALTEKIVDRMALQTTPTYRAALGWLQAFYDALHDGTVAKFVVNTPVSSSLTQLSQVSSASSTGPTQLSFATPPSPTPIIQMAVERQGAVEEKRAAAAQEPSEDTSDDVQAEQTSEPPSPRAAEASTTTRAATSTSRDTGTTPNHTGFAQKPPQDGSKEAPIVFAPPPRVRGLSKREKRRLAGGTELREARELAVKIRDGKKKRKARLDDVAALLEGAYSMDIAKGMVDALPLEDVEVSGAVCVRPFNVGQRVPKITQIPQLDKLQEAIQAIQNTGNENLLAYWPEYGSATLDQLEAMASVLEARNRFRVVQFTLDWIDVVEWQIHDVLPPFTDCSDYTKQTYKEAVKGMRLGKVHLGPEWLLGCSLVDFRENLWLHSSSIISAMLAMKQMYPNVGVINPSYHDLAGLSAKKKTAGGFGALDASNERVIAIICLDHHWAAYMVDKNKKLCYIFDPLQHKRNLEVVESSVRNIVEPLLGLKDMIRYETIDWCTQQDSSSCGVWCLIVLELLLAKRPWSDCLYKVQAFLRLWYLYKAIGVQQCEEVRTEE